MKVKKMKRSEITMNIYDDLTKEEREELEQKIRTSPAAVKLMERQKKLSQEQERIKDKLARLNRKETEAERKKRAHRLISLGANIEKHWGGKINENSPEMECLLYYLPILRRQYNDGTYQRQLEASRQKTSPETK